MAGPGKRNKGKAKGKGNNKRAAGIESPENEFLSTFKIINLCVETPHEAFPQDQEHFFLYLLSKRFLQNLEDYIAGKRNNPPSGDVNHDILKKIDDKEKFFWSNKPTEFNEYLTGGLKCWNDYIPVCDAAWDFITESYPSTAIYRRFHLGRKGFSPDFVVPEKVNLVFIHEDLPLELQHKIVQYDEDHTFGKVVQDIIGECLNEDDQDVVSDLYYKSKYYRLDTRISVDTFEKEVNDLIRAGLTKIDFRGFPVTNDLQDLEDTYTFDLFWDTSTLIIVIPSNTDAPQLSLIPIELPLDSSIKEYCEYCDERKNLIVECPCKRVFYCSIRCRLKNLGYHSKICLQSKDLKGLLDLNKAPESGELTLHTGLENLGNTCYMASILQALKMVPDLRDNLLSVTGEYLKSMAIEPKPHETNVFPYLVDFFKNVCWTKEKIYSPWLIKGSVGVNNVTFLKFNQCDSQEFFQSMVELIDEELKYWEVDPILDNVFKGSSKYVNTCLECMTEDNKEENWKFLSLPIPDVVSQAKINVKFIPLSFEERNINLKFRYDIKEDTLKNLKDFVYEKLENKTSNFVFALTEDSVLKGIYYDLSIKLSAVSKTLSNSDYSRSHLVCFEIKDSIEDIPSMQAVAVKCTKQIEFRNTMMTQETSVKYVLLFFVAKNASRRDIIDAFMKRINGLLPDDLKEYLLNPDILSLDAGVLDSPEYKLQLEKWTTSEPNCLDNTLTYTDILNNRLLNESFFKVSQEKNMNLDHEKLNELISALPYSKIIKFDYNNLKRGTCINCKNKNIHKCSFFPYDGQLERVEASVHKEEEDSSSKMEEKELQKTIKESEGPSTQFYSFVALVNHDKILQKLEENCLGDLVRKYEMEMPSVDLSFCLNSYQAPEKLGQENLVDCCKCQKKTERETQVKLSGLPKTLAIQLKRFKTIYTQNGSVKEVKNTSLVQYPHKLEIGCSNYELIAVVNHFGELRKGHYTALGKDRSNNTWIEFDDEKVTEKDATKICTSNGYLLFYLLIADCN